MNPTVSTWEEDERRRHREFLLHLALDAPYGVCNSPDHARVLDAALERTRPYGASEPSPRFR